MTTGHMNQVLRHLRGSARLPADADLTDGQLLGRFISRRDEAAFAALVRRHGPMVWGVCRRVLGRHHDAEDAFQATFLVLVRKAASITARGLLANFLYGVAYRTAIKARAVAARRQARERQVERMPEPVITPHELPPDVEPLLDEELSRLPDKYRVPIVLCDLQGQTRKQTARQLGCPEGTVAGRLARARTLLAKRLTRRGLVLSGGALAMALAHRAASACVPGIVVANTIRAASLFAAVKTAAPGAISAGAASLTDEVLKAMLMTKIKAALGACLAVGILALASVFGYQAVAADKPAPAKSDNNKLRDTILVLDKMWWEAAFKHDVDTLDKLMADNFVGLGSNGVRWTKATMLEQHQNYRNYDLKVLSEREVFRANEQTAVLTYEAKFSAMTKAGAPVGTAHQRLTSCWVQRDGGWFVAFWQVVNVPDAAPAKKGENKPVLLDPVLKPALLDPHIIPGTETQGLPWAPLRGTIDPHTFRPSLLAPLPPGTTIEFHPSALVPLDTSRFKFDLTIPSTDKSSGVPKGTGKGPGNANAGQDAGGGKPGTSKE
jgi:RNA polymerase sigma factor (sigma-70 family)